MSIPFTQYLRPNGRKRSLFIDRPQDIVDKAESLMEKGYRFEAEILRDEVTVSLTVVHPLEEIDVAIELVRNGSDVLGAVDRLIAKVYSEVV